MAGKILTRYRGLGRQLSANVYEDTGALDNQEDGSVSMLRAATLSALPSQPQGQNFEVGVIYKDQSNPALRPIFEIMLASYELDNGSFRWTRQETIESSNGGAAIDFATGTNNLLFYGVSTHQQSQNNNDKRLLDFGSYSGDGDWGVFTQDHALLTDAEGTVNSLVITPKNDQSILHYYASLGLQTQRVASGINARSRTTMFRRSFSGTWLAHSDGIDSGFFGMPTADSNFGIRSGISINSFMDQSQLTADGNWEIKPYVRVVEADTTVSILDCSLNWMEFGA